MTFEHRSVLLQETINELDVNPNGVYVDCTLGGGWTRSLLIIQVESTWPLICL